jgi:hypothetical protein
VLASIAGPCALKKGGDSSGPTSIDRMGRIAVTAGGGAGLASLAIALRMAAGVSSSVALLRRANAPGRTALGGDSLSPRRDL